MKKKKKPCLLTLKSNHLESSDILFVISSSVAWPTSLDSRLSRWRWAYTVQVEAVSARGIAGAPVTVHVTPPTSGVKASSPPVSAMSPHPHDNTLVVRSHSPYYSHWYFCGCFVLFGNGNSLGQMWQSAESLRQIDTVLCRVTSDVYILTLNIFITI